MSTRRRGRAACLVSLVLPLLALSSSVLRTHGAEAAEEIFPVVDLHVDLPWQLHFKKRALDLGKGQMSRSAIAKGHVRGIVLPLYVPDEVHAEGPRIEDHLGMLSTLDRLLEQPESPFASFDPAAPPRPGAVKLFVSFEGAGAFADDPERIDPFFEHGLRLVGLVHMHDNALGTSSTGAAKNRGKDGLTEKGKTLAHRVYEKGGLVDVSHLSDAGFVDLLPIAKAHGAPLVATHSDARAVWASPRNLTDEQLRLIGASGGVVGLNLHAPYLAKGVDAGWPEIVAQATHLAKIAGEDHVAIGSDFEGGIVAPSDMKDASAFPELARRLLAAGMSPTAVRKMFAENALRILVKPTPAALPDRSSLSDAH